MWSAHWAELRNERGGQFHLNEALNEAIVLNCHIVYISFIKPRAVLSIIFLQPFIMNEWAFYVFTGKFVVQRMSSILWTLQRVIIMRNRAPVTRCICYKAKKFYPLQTEISRLNSSAEIEDKI